MEIVHQTVKSWVTELSAEGIVGTENPHVFKHRQLSLNRYPFKKIKCTEATFGLRVPECQKAGKHSKRIRHACPLLTLSKQLLRTALGNKALATRADQYSSPYRPKPGNAVQTQNKDFNRLSQFLQKTHRGCSCFINSSNSPCSNFSGVPAYFYVVQSHLFWRYKAS